MTKSCNAYTAPADGKTSSQRGHTAIDVMICLASGVEAPVILRVKGAAGSYWELTGDQSPTQFAPYSCDT
jgi:hypothetical protein